MGEKIGEFLIEIGKMNRSEVDTVLERQKGGDGRLFGQIALEMGLIEDDALRRFIEYKEKNEAVV